MPRPVDLLKRWQDGQTFSLNARLDHWTNIEYVAGRQWIVPDPHSGLPRKMHNPDGRLRETYNMVGPNWRTIVGKFIGNPLVFDVPPNGTDDQSVRGARLAQWVVRKAAYDDRWEVLRRQAIEFTLLGGSALVVINPLADPSTNVVSGKPAPKVACLDVFPIPSFVCEPGASSFSKSRWFITQRALPPEEVKEHYNLGSTPKADTQSVSAKLRSERTGRNVVDNLTSVYVMYERPTVDRDGNRQNKGRVIHAIPDETLVDDRWPYPFDEHPGYCFVTDDTSESWIADTFVTDARKPQDSLNYYKSLQAEAGRAMVPKMAVPNGFDVDQLNDDPLTPLQYDPSMGGGDAIPRWISGDSGTLRMRYDIEAAKEHIDAVMHVHDLSRGIGPDRSSGQAIAILVERDDTPLSLIAGDQQMGWSHLATQYLKIAEKAVTSEVISTVKVGASVMEMRWSGKLLANQTIVDVPKSSTMPFSRSARLKLLTDAMQMMPQAFALLSPIQQLKLLDLPDLADVGHLLDPDVEKAQRENYLMADLGKACIPQRDEDHPKHLAEHRAFRQSAAYDALDLDTQQIILDHERVHDRMLEEEVLSQRDLNEEMPGMSTIPSSLNMIGQVGPEPQPTPMNTY